MVQDAHVPQQAGQVVNNADSRAPGVDIKQAGETASCP